MQLLVLVVDLCVHADLICLHWILCCILRQLYERGLVRGRIRNMVGGQFDVMPGNMQEHNMSMHSFLQEKKYRIPAVRRHKLTD